MPLIVDHDERRELIANVVKRIIAKSGVQAVTMRNVAREVGFSSTIVSHYFRDKRDLLSFTYGSIRTRGIQMIAEAFARDAGLLECLEALLPVSEENLVNWQAWFGFWGTTTSDVGLAAKRVSAVEGTHDSLLQILGRAKAQGELPEHLDSEFHARRLQMVINGLSSFVVMQPALWPPETQRAFLVAEVDAMKSREAEKAAGVAPTIEN